MHFLPVIMILAGCVLPVAQYNLSDVSIPVSVGKSYAGLGILLILLVVLMYILGRERRKQPIAGWVFGFAGFRDYTDWVVGGKKV